MFNYEFTRGQIKGTLENYFKDEKTRENYKQEAIQNFAFKRSKSPVYDP
jgi:hypothetical protein